MGRRGPATTNRPTPRKAASGREPEPTILVRRDVLRLYKTAMACALSSAPPRAGIEMRGPLITRRFVGRTGGAIFGFISHYNPKDSPGHLRVGCWLRYARDIACIFFPWVRPLANPTPSNVAGSGWVFASPGPPFDSPRDYHGTYLDR